MDSNGLFVRGFDADILGTVIADKDAISPLGLEFDGQ
jgi:hypothetical protein